MSIICRLSDRVGDGDDNHIQADSQQFETISRAREILHLAPVIQPKDEEELHDERIKLWNDFNTCWLAVLQKQKDTTQEIIDLGQQPIPPQSYFQKDFLEKLGGELVRVCDGVERHGLVDYQVGVWEEEIISILDQCLDLPETLEGKGSKRLVGRRGR